MNQTSLHNVNWSDLPTPPDDGLCDHLTGTCMPDVSLPSTSGETVNLGSLQGISVLFFYPMTAQPGTALPADWDSIPGARGCTPEACEFSTLSSDLRTTGIRQLFGISTQSTQYQQEAVNRLQLDYALLSDESLVLCNALKLPTFEVESEQAEGNRLIKRLTLLIANNQITKVFYPIFPPDKHPQQVLSYLTDNPP